MNGAWLLGGRYQLRGPLGRAGMAGLHKGCDLRFSRPVTVKLLRPGLPPSPRTSRASKPRPACRHIDQPAYRDGAPPYRPGKKGQGDDR